MDKYEICKRIKIGDKWYDSLVCIVFNEEAAHETVQALRKAMGNQLCYFKKIN